MKCLECGHDLIEMRRELVEFNELHSLGWPRIIYDYSLTEYAGHCKNCLCDWEWEEIFKDGKVTVTQPARIFWG